MELVVGLVVSLAAAWLVFVAVHWLHRPTRELAGPAIRIIPDVVRLTRSLLADRQTPPIAKVALAGMLIYLVSPIDLIPDFIPVVGQLDDIVVAALVLRWTGRRIGIEGLRAHWSGSDAGFEVLLRMLGL
jgi:uncharacterized membrane protein YkvA (DUF1232 family)